MKTKSDIQKTSNGKPRSSVPRGATKGISLHIGLNHVDPSKYKDQDGNPWDGELAGCINDALAMQNIAVAQGFQTTLFTDEQATSSEVIKTVARIATDLSSGDILLLTYSGHGGQIPDVNGEEEDGQDETWCLFDRMLLDDELYNLWTQFAAGVRIYVLSDSCHSGTVLKQVIYSRLPPLAPLTAPLGRNRTRSKETLEDQALRIFRNARPPRYRNLPSGVETGTYRAQKEMYDAVQWAAGRSGLATVGAHVLLLSGCQDNQLSADGDKNGLFTQTLLETWADGKFVGNYAAFATSIIGKMPGTQTPNYYKVGPADAVFEGQKPFTIASNVGAAAAPTVASKRPSIAAENDSIARSDDPPRFRVSTGANGYYIVEIAADVDLLANRPDGNSAEFYATYYDQDMPNRETGSTFTLPDFAWQLLKSADRLYYRVGTTSTETGWDDYALSTEDGDEAPSLEITAAQGTVGSGPATDAPSITAESASMPRDGGPPRFQISTGSNDYFIVEVAARANLFVNRPEENTAEFYATYFDENAAVRETGSSFTLPEDAWQGLKRADRLYYRIGTTSSENGWGDYALSTEDDAEPPSLEVTGEVGRVPPRRAAKPLNSKTKRTASAYPPVSTSRESPWVHGSPTPDAALRVAQRTI